VRSDQAVSQGSSDTVDTHPAPPAVRAWLIAQGVFFVVVGVLLLIQAFQTAFVVHPNDPAVRFLAPQGGRVVALVIGLGLFGAGAALTYTALARPHDWDLAGAPPRRRIVLHRVGRIGLVGRGLAFAIPGLIICADALVYSPEHPGRVTQAVLDFLARPYGRVLLVVAAMVLLAFAVYAFASARYRVVPERAPRRRPVRAPGRARRGWARTGVLFGAGIAIWAVTAGVGYLLVRVLSPSVLTRWDNDVSEWFYLHRTPMLDPLTHVGSGLADTTTCIAVAAVMVVVLRLWLGRWWESIVTVVAIQGELLIFLVITATVHRARPTVPHLDAAPPTSSYPSGHTGAAVALYGCLAIIVYRNVARRWLAGMIIAPLLALPFIVGLSRIYRGMHFATDVLAGAVAGGLWLAVVVIVLLVRRQPPAAPERQPDGTRTTTAVLRH
jgi:membrane-associated phospholipid phosphatase